MHGLVAFQVFGPQESLFHHLVGGVVEVEAHPEVLFLRQSQQECRIGGVQGNLHPPPLDVLDGAAGGEPCHVAARIPADVEKGDALAGLELAVGPHGVAGRVLHFHHQLVQGVVEAIARAQWVPAPAVEMAVLQGRLERLLESTHVIGFLQPD